MVSRARANKRWAVSRFESPRDFFAITRYINVPTRETTRLGYGKCYLKDGNGISYMHYIGTSVKKSNYEHMNKQNINRVIFRYTRDSKSLYTYIIYMYSLVLTLLNLIFALDCASSETCLSIQCLRYAQKIRYTIEEY